MTTNNNIADAQLEFGKDLALRIQPNDVTEQKIREAFIKYSGGYAPASFATSYLDFKAGYLALLNELLPTGNQAVSHMVGRTKHMSPTYMLPE